ncbi:Type I restriction-modification system (specificity subunit) (plasmid) [Aromatoleum aromaticum EbN1]|uniref:Type I restriction-modification system (Specificity subunit) n=1 Tax=Aromatoleum aromaticum (strain DSM 19018 / LMG 30748 / EbN1) TaxID=76114 RepID=Q5NWK8_AROAE|nr:restriction endonuclease subunit S [Aromatoleum aromaticum]CAI10556.1 Type I restriction-modification system (specificity subunit) [Aromatoleum aromaticum EbN1]
MTFPRFRLADVCDINPRLPRTHGITDDTLVSFVPMAAVDELTGTIATSQSRSFAEVKKGYTSFRENDVLFAKITPCMENGKAALAQSLVGGVGFGSTEFHVLRAGPQVLPEWLRYFVRREEFRREAKRNFTGTAGQQRVPTTFLSGAEIPVPSLDEQRRIVDLLSRAEGIVRLRREAQRKAAEIIPALFVDMFGDPATNPKGWPVTTIGSLSSYTRYGPRFPDRPYAAEGAHILRTTDMGYSGDIHWSDAPVLPVTVDELEKYHLRPGTLLVTRTGATIGKIAIFRGAEEPCIAGAYLIEIGFQAQVIPEYILHFLLSAFGQSQLVRGSRAVAQPNINAPTICAIPIPLPPLEIQARFAASVDQLRAAQGLQESAMAKAEAIFNSLLAQVFSRDDQRAATRLEEAAVA